MLTEDGYFITQLQATAAWFASPLANVLSAV
jgi:hypothetical protein